MNEACYKQKKQAAIKQGKLIILLTKANKASTRRQAATSQMK
jgi:hypothetical protein